MFDWDAVDEDAREVIREKSGQDARRQHQGFLMYAADRPTRIYLGDGGMETFTTKVDDFVAGLSQR